MVKNKKWSGSDDTKARPFQDEIQRKLSRLLGNSEKLMAKKVAEIYWLGELRELAAPSIFGGSEIGFPNKPLCVISAPSERTVGWSSHHEMEK